MTSLSLPFHGETLVARQHSATGAAAAQEKRATHTKHYLDHLARHGVFGQSDHEAAQALGYPLSSINSIRNGVRRLVWAADRAQCSPVNPKIKRTRWRLATEAEQAINAGHQAAKDAEQPTLQESDAAAL